MQLKGKNVLITGAAMGVGKAVAEAVLTEGAKVVIVDVSQEAGEATTSSLRDTFGADAVHFIQCDITDEEAFEGAFKAAVEKVGHVHIMCNNAGIMNEKNWKLMVLLNYNAVVVGTQMALEHMRKDKGGEGGIIINMSSFVGLIPLCEIPIYTGTKHAVVGFTRSWAANPHLPAMGVRFGVVCPAAVDTALQQFPDDQILYAETYRKKMAAVGIISTEAVARSFLKLIQEDDSNGACCTIDPKERIAYRSPVLVEGNKNFKGEPF